MDDDRTVESHRVPFGELEGHLRRVRGREIDERPSGASPPYSYEMKLGREIVQLGLVEFRILRLLASRPYRAFTRNGIADAVSTRRHPVDSETLDGHIARLRNSLGFFGDYIQTVPNIGYRFRA